MINTNINLALFKVDFILKYKNIIQPTLWNTGNILHKTSVFIMNKVSVRISQQGKYISKFVHQFTRT